MVKVSEEGFERENHLLCQKHMAVLAAEVGELTQGESMDWEEGRAKADPQEHQAFRGRCGKRSP